jgi:hypothetical protein
VKTYAKTRGYAVVSASDPTAVAQDGYETLGEALAFAAQCGPEFVAAEVRRETTVIAPFGGTPLEGTEVGRDVFLGEDCEFEGTDGRVVDARVEDGGRFVLVEAEGLGRAWEMEHDVVPFDVE